MKQATQISRPMQIALVATLVLFAVWFGVIKPKAASDDVATAPVTPAVSRSTAASTPGRSSSALDKTAYSKVKEAREAAAKASADAAKSSAQTGEGTASGADAASSSKSTSTKSSKSAAAATTPAAAAATTPAAAAPAATPPMAASKAAAAKAPAVSAAQRHANHVILKIKKDLAARKAVVVLVWSSKGTEDKVLHERISKQINLRHGKVKTFFIPVGQVGRYDGLLSGLGLGQTPSTIVIAPNHQAQVLGGLTSVARLDRLTSAAVLTKPAATTP